LSARVYYFGGFASTKNREPKAASAASSVNPAR
jgi:hypothetical protein